MKTSEPVVREFGATRAYWASVSPVLPSTMEAAAVMPWRGCTRGPSPSTMVETSTSAGFSGVGNATEAGALPMSPVAVTVLDDVPGWARGVQSAAASDPAPEGLQAASVRTSPAQTVSAAERRT
ncbi:hypothetical protein [Clavibacter zhangzhiyongii]|uniref:hypothetical protein n=1 Tax=Clavibacter zhangzhiyongii TaxID=2768071 RepID=UPI0039DFD10B